MASRINNLLTHISARDIDSVEMQHIKQRLALASLTNQFTLPLDRLKEITLYMIREMIEGLEGRFSSLCMLPSFVYKDDTSKASGAFYAVDFGGTNCRVLRVAIRNGQVEDYTDCKFLIPSIARIGDRDDLFGFIAKCVKKTILEKSPEDMKKPLNVGFTFSFPCEQKSLNTGKLVAFGKGFATKNVVGKDVVQLLQSYLNAESIHATVVALCNDTVGTLVARYFEDPNCAVSVIIGTGTNAAYFERSDAVSKNPVVAAHGSKMTAINIEGGLFDFSNNCVLPVTPFDKSTDLLSPRTKGLFLEKLVSGMYLGEITRQILIKLSAIGCLPREIMESLDKPWSFETRHVGMICADQLPALQFTRALLKQLIGVDITEVEDLHLVREVCRLVRNRSASMYSVLVSAPLLKNHSQGLATVAVDGSVFEKTPSYQRLFQESINKLLGPESNVKVCLQRDGSGLGAALIAALVSSK